jgi:hypothetical protein
MRKLLMALNVGSLADPFKHCLDCQCEGKPRNPNTFTDQLGRDQEVPPRATNSTAKPPSSSEMRYS